jgi:4-amino-4-deoxy-L-arabinose transferase-like glycosyltransferase
VSVTTRTLVILLALAHLAFASYFAVVTPYRQSGILLGQRDQDGGPARVPDVGAPDERQHANYVQHLLDGKGFPMLDPKDPKLEENYQAHQPPLYYVLASGFAKVTGVSSVDEQSGRSLRFLNVAIGAGTVVGGFFLALWGLGSRAAAVASGLFIALLPMNLALSGAISNDPLLYLICTWTLALAAKALRNGWTASLASAVGTLAGLALLTKTTGIALFPILLLAAFLPQVSKPSGKQLVMALVPAILIPLPWLLRNQGLYGDPFAIAAFNKTFVNSPQASFYINALGAQVYWTEWVGWWTARSYIGAFGYMDIFLNETGRPGSRPETFYRLAIAALGLATLAWTLLVSKPSWKESKPVQILNMAFFLVVAVLFIRFNMQYFQGQARYLFPAIGPVACGIGMVLASAKSPKVSVGAFGAVMLALALYSASILPAEFAKRVL